MKILALEQELVGPGEVQFGPPLKSEAARVWELYQKGIVREIYFRESHPQAVLVLECRDVKEASHILGTLPLVKHGLSKFELIPLIPYPGFERLFK